MPILEKLQPQAVFVNGSRIFLCNPARMIKKMSGTERNGQILQLVLMHCVQKRPGRSHGFSGALNLTRIKQKA
jgi:hypothetical protein